MSLETAVGLIVAISELKAVRAVTQAINANLPKDGPLGTIRPSSAQLHARPRQYYSPTPDVRPLPRPVIEPTARHTAGGDYFDRTAREVHAAASAPSGPWTMGEPCLKKSGGPFDAPWKHLPPVDNVVAEIRVNLIRPKVDLRAKGTLLDVYV